MNNTWHKIIIGDSRHMGEVPDESVHLIITSPPYWQLIDYGDEKQISFHDSYERYINNLKSITARKIIERFPKLKKQLLWGGAFWSVGKYIGTVEEAINEKFVKKYTSEIRVWINQKPKIG